MSVHSNHYNNEEEYERDLAWEYRKERYDGSCVLYYWDDEMPDEEYNEDEDITE